MTEPSHSATGGSRRLNTQSQQHGSGAALNLSGKVRIWRGTFPASQGCSDPGSKGQSLKRKLFAHQDAPRPAPGRCWQAGVQRPPWPCLLKCFREKSKSSAGRSVGEIKCSPSEQHLRRLRATSRCLYLHTFHPEGAGRSPGRGRKLNQAPWHSQGYRLPAAWWGGEEIKTRITCHLLCVIKESSLGYKPRLIASWQAFLKRMADSISKHVLNCPSYRGWGLSSRE